MAARASYHYPYFNSRTHVQPYFNRRTYVRAGPGASYQYPHLNSYFHRRTYMRVRDGGRTGAHGGTRVRLEGRRVRLGLHDDESREVGRQEK